MKVNVGQIALFLGALFIFLAAAAYLVERSRLSHLPDISVAQAAEIALTRITEDCPTAGHSISFCKAYRVISVDAICQGDWKWSITAVAPDYQTTRLVWVSALGDYDDLGVNDHPISQAGRDDLARLLSGRSPVPEREVICKGAA